VLFACEMNTPALVAVGTFDLRNSPTFPTMPAFVYLLRCRDGSLYCGWTDDLERRVATHNAGKGARYTRSRKPVRLVWSEELADRSAALKREIAVKRLTRVQKLALAGLTRSTTISGLAKRRRVRPSRA
jgi:putative endonuclease